MKIVSSKLLKIDHPENLKRKKKKTVLKTSFKCKIER